MYSVLHACKVSRSPWPVRDEHSLSCKFMGAVPKELHQSIPDKAVTDSSHRVGVPGCQVLGYKDRGLEGGVVPEAIPGPFVRCNSVDLFAARTEPQDRSIVPKFCDHVVPPVFQGYRLL